MYRYYTYINNNRKSSIHTSEHSALDNVISSYGKTVKECKTLIFNKTNTTFCNKMNTRIITQIYSFIQSYYVHS